MKQKTLLSELLDQRNIYFNEDQSFIMTKTFTNLLFSLIIVFALTALIVMVITDFVLFELNLTFNDYLSLCFGNICFYYCFVFIKERIIPYYKSNPLFLIGLIYPAFFNASFVSLFIPNLNLLVMLVSVLLYYLILNRYYQKRWSHE